MKRHILLLKPNGKDTQYGMLKDLSAIEPPLWMAIYANKYYQMNTTVELLDAEAENLTLEQTVEKVLSKNPDKVIILATGNHPSAHIQQKDLAIRLDILLSTKVTVEVYYKLPFDPCDYPAPRWDLLDMSKYRAHNWHCWGEENRSPYGVVFTSLGCPFNCSFCCIKDFYGQTFKQRKVSDVLYDFDTLAKLGVKNIKIMDELFTCNPTRVKEICDKIIAEGYDFNIWAYARIDAVDGQLLEVMRKAGIKWLAYGIESGNEEIRKEIVKGKFNNLKIEQVVQQTKDYGINVLGNFMFGFLDDTIDTMKETRNFAEKLNCEYVNYYCTVGYPGSKLYEEVVGKGILPTDSTQYAQMSKSFKPLPTKTLTAKEVLHFRDTAFTYYFQRPSYIDMMMKKFGTKVVTEIDEMLKIKVERI